MLVKDVILQWEGFINLIGTGFIVIGCILRKKKKVKKIRKEVLRDIGMMLVLFGLLFISGIMYTNSI